MESYNRVTILHNRNTSTRSCVALQKRLPFEILLPFLLLLLLLLLSTVELNLSGLIGAASRPDMQKIRIIEFFFENRLHW